MQLAFALQNLTETEIRLLQALDSHPGKTSAEISRLMGWKGQSFHMHLGAFCQRRCSSHMKPPPSGPRSSSGKEIPFWSGIIAEGESVARRWVWRGLKPPIRALLVDRGILQPRRTPKLE